MGLLQLQRKKVRFPSASSYIYVIFKIRGKRKKIKYNHTSFGASLAAHMVKNPPAKWETWVRSLGQEDPLEKEMATHSSILAWRIPWTEEPGRLQSTGLRRVGHDWAASPSLSLSPRYVDVLPSVYPCTFSRTWSCLADEAAMNICVLIFGRISASIFLGFISRSEMADNMTDACLAF